MKNLTEKSKVESYLKNLMEIEGFTIEDLMHITVFDMLGNSELEGVSKTALSEALDSYKKKLKSKKSIEDNLIPATLVKEESLIPAKNTKEEGLIPATHAKEEVLIPATHTKKERVTRFLTKFMKEPDFKVADLMNLTIHDLSGNLELEGIGKTTINGSFRAFKEKYLKIQYSSKSKSEQPDSKASNSNNSKDFNSDQGNEVTADLEVDKLENLESQTLILKKKTKEESFENVGKNENKTVAKRKSAKQQKVGDTSLNALTSDDMATIKKMIDRFKAEKMNTVSPIDFELMTLKHALRHFGFDYRTMLEQYRKNVE